MVSAGLAHRLSPMPADLHRTDVDFALHEDAAAELFGSLHRQWPAAPAAFLDSSDHARGGATAGAPSRSRYSILAFSLGAEAQGAEAFGSEAMGAEAASVELSDRAWEWVAHAWMFDRAETVAELNRQPGQKQLQHGHARLDPPFQLGWVGFVGYEGQGRFFRATHAIVVDHDAGTAQLQSMAEDRRWAASVCQEIQHVAALAGSAEACTAAAATADSADAGSAEAAAPDIDAGAAPSPDREWAFSGGKINGSAGNTTAKRPPEGSCTADSAAYSPLHSPLAQLRVRDSRAAYLKKITEAHRQIREGNSYEICLTTAVTGQFTGSPWQAYRRLREHNRAPFTQYLYLPGAADDVVILSTSPERFMQVCRDGKLRSEPIKGTRPRGADPRLDAPLRTDLSTHPKDRAENVMITDLVRNDLSIYAAPGTLRTERLCAVETYPSVHQMVSTVSAQLDAHAERAEALAAAFPPGSMTGAPKISTMDILTRLETGDRGPYSGAAGYFSTTGACDLSVLIRTAALTRSHQGRPAVVTGSPTDHDEAWGFHLGLGGAITADSVPEDEWQEVITKSRGVLGALGAEFPQ